MIIIEIASGIGKALLIWAGLVAGAALIVLASIAVTVTIVDLIILLRPFFG